MSRVATTVEQFWHKVPGGTAQATAQTLVALQAEGTHEYVGVAARHSADERPHIANPIPTFHARWPRPLLYDSWHRVSAPTVQSIVDGPVDLIWASAMAVPPPSVPTVVTIHDLEFLEHPEWLSGRGKTFFPRAWRAAQRRAALMVCPSQTVAAACEAHGVEPHRIRIVPWGVDSTRIDPDSAGVVHQQFNLPDRFALWVGTLEPRKNLERVVAAVEVIDGLHLAVVGPTGWNVDSEAVIEPLGDRAHLLGEVSADDLSKLYAAASVFVFPSLAEGFGLPVLEAMAQGTPVVTSANTATADAAAGAALLVEPTRSDLIASAVHSVLSDSDLSKRLSDAGLVVAANSGWAQTARGYSDVFSELTP